VREWDGGFYGVGEGEEACGGGEHGFYFFEGDFMVDEAEESVCFGGGEELGGYFVDAGGEGVEADFGDAAGGVFCWCHCEEGDAGVVLCVKVDGWD